MVEATAEARDQWRAICSTRSTAPPRRGTTPSSRTSPPVSAIEQRLANVDTLTLRREESDEIMKSVLRFVLGAEFDFMPDEVHKAFLAASVDLAHGVGFDADCWG